MKAKKRIFIGSSWESRETAYQIEATLRDSFECVLWYEGFFTLGEHYYNDLVRKIITFDYAIMIGGEDDMVTRIATGAVKKSPRDNVYLEYGLFSGILSPDRVLMLMHKSCSEASDLSGMSLYQYNTAEEATILASKWLIGHLERSEHRSIGRKNVELLPTVGIAVGYFYNFIKTFTNKLLNDPSINICNVRLNVCVPDFICDDVTFYSDDLIWKKGLKKDNICEFRILRDPTAEAIELYDVPNTILALFKTVDYIFENQGGNTDDTLCAKARALDNFYDNLNVLVQNDPYAQRIVKLSRYSKQN